MNRKALLLLTVIAAIAGALILTGSPPGPLSIFEGQQNSLVTSSEQNRNVSEDPEVANQSAGVDSSAELRADERGPFSRERIPALPNVSGFELSSYGQEAARVLAAEDRDPIWAARMEDRILDAIEDFGSLQIARIELECRMTACGILMVHDPDTDANSRVRIQVTGNIRDGLAEMLGFGETKGVTSFRSSGDFSAIYLTRAEGREQYAESATVPALPGIGGFEVARGGDAASMHPALYLASRPEDPTWSTPMEARIVHEVSQRVAENAPTQIVVECRSYACGIVLAYPVGTEPIESRIGNELSDALDLPMRESDWHETAGGPFMTIYLHGRRYDGSSTEYSDVIESFKDNR